MENTPQSKPAAANGQVCFLLDSFRGCAPVSASGTGPLRSWCSPSNSSLSDLHLQPLEVRDPHRAPALRRPDHRPEHQLQDRPLAPGIGNDLQPPALPDEQPLQKVGRPDRTTVVHRHPQMGDAGLEVVEEAGDRTRKRPGELSFKPPGQVPCDRP